MRRNRVSNSSLDEWSAHVEHNPGLLLLCCSILRRGRTHNNNNNTKTRGNYNVWPAFDSSSHWARQHISHWLHPAPDWNGSCCQLLLGEKQNVVALLPFIISSRYVAVCCLCRIQMWRTFGSALHQKTHVCLYACVCVCVRRCRFIWSSKWNLANCCAPSSANNKAKTTDFTGETNAWRPIASPTPNSHQVSCCCCRYERT